MRKTRERRRRVHGVVDAVFERIADGNSCDDKLLR
jgi:DNA-binding FrmR family transcriptional regulator